MKSLDANLLVYAHNTGCTEHPAAFAVLTNLIAEPSDWMLADQTLLEFYRCVRNPLVLAKPLSAPDAAVIIDKLTQSNELSEQLHALLGENKGESIQF